jgi:hypothetical protein
MKSTTTSSPEVRDEQVRTTGLTQNLVHSLLEMSDADSRSSRDLREISFLGKIISVNVDVANEA